MALVRTNRSTDVFKIVVIGDSGVGKTSIIQRFVNKCYVTYNATVGPDILQKTIAVDGRQVTINLWDTAGQERENALPSMFFRKADAAIIVYDITNSKSFTNLPKWFQYIDGHGIENVLILGNMSDVAYKRQVTIAQAKSFANLKTTLYFEVSAKNADNVDAAFLGLCKNLLKPKILKQDTIHLEKKVPAKKSETSSCCNW